MDGWIGWSLSGQHTVRLVYAESTARIDKVMLNCIISLAASLFFGWLSFQRRNWQSFGILERHLCKLNESCFYCEANENLTIFNVIGLVCALANVLCSNLLAQLTASAIVEFSDLGRRICMILLPSFLLKVKVFHISCFCANYLVPALPQWTTNQVSMKRCKLVWWNKTQEWSNEMWDKQGIKRERLWVAQG